MDQSYKTKCIDLTMTTISKIEIFNNQYSLVTDLKVNKIVLFFVQHKICYKKSLQDLELYISIDTFESVKKQKLNRTLLHSKG